MVRSYIALLTAVTASSIAGQEGEELFRKARAKILEDAGRVPRYTCVQTVERAQYQPLYGQKPQSCKAIIAARKHVAEGDMKSSGVGTYLFRKYLYERAFKEIGEASLLQLTFGHGTSNGRLLRGTLVHGVGDPNRAVHNEWLRILYEWGGVGLGLWFVFIFSMVIYAIEGARKDRLGHARPLLIFIPAFLGGFSTENIIAGAGHAENLGFLLLAALAAVSHRKRVMYLPTSAPVPYVKSNLPPRVALVRPYYVPSPVRRQAL